MDNLLISSTEELSPEDRLLLASKRQEPQGEEYDGGKGGGGLEANNNNGKRTNHNNNHSNKGPGGIHSCSSSSSDEDEDDDGIVYQNVGNLQGKHTPRGGSGSNSGSGSGSGSRTQNPCNLSLDSNSHSTYNTLIIHHNNASLLADTWIPASHEFTSLSSAGSNRNSTSSNPRRSQSPSRSGGGGGGGVQESSYLHHHPQYAPPPPSSSTGLFDYEKLRKEVGVGNKGKGSHHELSEIPSDYLNQLTVLKHLAKEVQQDSLLGMGLDPSTGSSASSKLLRSASFSRSQPDLSQQQMQMNMVLPPPPPMPMMMGSMSQGGGVSGPSSYYTGNYPPPKPTGGGGSKKNREGSVDVNVTTAYSDHDTGSGTTPSTSVQMLEILMRENSNLRAELAKARMKIQTIHKLEAELTRLQKQHAALFESAERRENLERTARAKLSTEVKRLTAVNRELLSSSNSLQNLSSYSLGPDVEAYKKELSRKDMQIAQLITQNKELAATKERQDIELAAQRATLEEQRTHIDILDSALTTAQGNVVRLEEEARRNQDYADKVSQLQRALAALQIYNEKREQSEKKMRAQLESEITELKLQLASKNAKSNCNLTSANKTPVTTPVPQKNYTAPPPYPGTSSNHSSTQNLNQGQSSTSGVSGCSGSTASIDLAPELQHLQEKLKLSEDKIQSLTQVVQKWEQFFGGEGNMKNENNKSSNGNISGNSSTSNPNTPNSWSSRGGTPHFTFNGNGGGSGPLDETQNRATELEWKIKDLESRLVEKDNILRAMGAQQQQQQQQYAYSPMYNTPYVPTGYRESPNYTQAAMMHQQHQQQQHQHQHQKSGGGLGSYNHQVSLSMSPRFIDPVLFYEKVGKCESEPPSYANLPPKLRLGGSGSSLAKNSNESLGSAGLGSSVGSGTGSGTHNQNNGNGVMSEPESVSSEQSSSSRTKNIDEQLKELNTQLLSKGTMSGLKTQTGLCCIPGFVNSGTPTRKGKIPQSLLESVMYGPESFPSLSGQTSNNNTNPPMMMTSSSATNNANNNNSNKTMMLPPLPRPPPNNSSQSNTPHQSLNQNNNSSRTSSGPPFLGVEGSSSAASNPGGNHTLSNSVDSILDSTPKMSKKPLGVGVGGMMGSSSGSCNVFAPAALSGLPPKIPGSGDRSSKCRSLEREQKSKSSGGTDGGNGGSGTSGSSRFVPPFTSPSERCKSLDRRELKQKEKERKEKEKEKGSTVSSKAAFFGGLLSRRSPSPSRKKEGLEPIKGSPGPSRATRFLFGGGKSNNTTSNTLSVENSNKDPSTASTSTTSSEQEIDTAFLDHQGRASQNQRLTRSKWESASGGGAGGSLASVSSVTISPWVQRRSGGGGDSTTPSGSRKQSTEDYTIDYQHKLRAGSVSKDEDVGRKWGKIVKSPFGLRYTFGGGGGPR